jgi:hypothetical protein
MKGGVSEERGTTPLVLVLPFLLRTLRGTEVLASAEKGPDAVGQQSV